jgi:hypothetical protein
MGPDSNEGRVYRSVSSNVGRRIIDWTIRGEVPAASALEAAGFSD